MKAVSNLSLTTTTVLLLLHGFLLFTPAEAWRKRLRKTFSQMIEKELEVDTAVTKEEAAVEEIVEEEENLVSDFKSLESEREKKIAVFLETEAKHYEDVVSFCNSLEKGEEEAAEKCINDVTEKEPSLAQLSEELTEDTEEEIAEIEESMTVVAAEAEREAAKLTHGVEKINHVSQEYNDLDPTYFDQDVQDLKEQAATLQESVVDPADVLVSGEENICLEFTNVLELFDPNPILEASFFSIIELGIEIAINLARDNAMDVDNLALQEQYLTDTHERSMLRTDNNNGRNLTRGPRKLRMKVSSSYNCACKTDALRSDVVRRRRRRNLGEENPASKNINFDRNLFWDQLKDIGQDFSQTLGELVDNNDSMADSGGEGYLLGDLARILLPDSVITVIRTAIRDVFKTLTEGAIIPCSEYDADNV